MSNFPFNYRNFNYGTLTPLLFMVKYAVSRLSYIVTGICGSHRGKEGSHRLHPCYFVLAISGRLLLKFGTNKVYACQIIWVQHPQNLEANIDAGGAAWFSAAHYRMAGVKKQSFTRCFGREVNPFGKSLFLYSHRLVPCKAGESDPQPAADKIDYPYKPQLNVSKCLWSYILLHESPMTLMEEEEPPLLNQNLHNQDAYSQTGKGGSPSFDAYIWTRTEPCHRPWTL